MTDQATTGPTVKTVVQHAEKLRGTAERIMAGDPYASPWYPTTAGARQQYHRELAKLRADHGVDAFMEPVDETGLEAEAARRAIAWMERKVARDVVERAEQERHSQERHKIHRHHQRMNARKVEAERERLTPGQRIDVALAALSSISNVPAAALDGDRVKGGGGGARDERHPGDVAGKARHEAIKCVRFVERELDEAKRRLVEEEH